MEGVGDKVRVEEEEAERLADAALTQRDVKVGSGIVVVNVDVVVVVLDVAVFLPLSSSFWLFSLLVLLSP